ncbi:hypothetical protein [Sphingopyxis sp.]|uniref:hypothetical protein n=1 Tax=Sphingopyxis sp. TaxID=1908224 RepID=UPI003D6CE805
MTGEPWTRERLAEMCRSAILDMEGDAALYAAMPASMRRQFDNQLAALKDTEARCGGVTVIIKRGSDAE